MPNLQRDNLSRDHTVIQAINQENIQNNLTVRLIILNSLFKNHNKNYLNLKRSL